MPATFSSPIDEIALLKRQLAIAEGRLERAQRFVFDLRCLVAKNKGGTLAEGEGSIWFEGCYMGRYGRARRLDLDQGRLISFSVSILSPLDSASSSRRTTLFQSEDVPEPSASDFTSSTLGLQAELSVPSPSSSSSPFKQIPPELFYHIVEHSPASTISTLDSAGPGRGPLKSQCSRWASSHPTSIPNFSATFREPLSYDRLDVR
jgi:hypothetical protein